MLEPSNNVQTSQKSQKYSPIDYMYCLHRIKQSSKILMGISTRLHLFSSLQLLKIEVFVLCLYFLVCFSQLADSLLAPSVRTETLSHAFLQFFFPFIFLTLARMSFIFNNSYFCKSVSRKGSIPLPLNFVFQHENVIVNLQLPLYFDEY